MVKQQASEDQSGAASQVTPAHNAADSSVLLSAGPTGDIPEREAVQAALSASELRYRRLFESAQGGIMILDAESGAVFDVNPYLLDILGFTREEICGKQLWELGFFSDIVASKASFLELQQKDYARYEDLPLETASGERRDVEIVSNVYMVGNHKVIQCNIRDITERKRLEAALSASELRYRRLFESAQGGIMILDAESGVVFDVNPYLLDMLGFTHEEICGKQLWELGFISDIVASKASFLELQQKNYVRYEDLPLETASGERRDVEFVSNVYMVGNHEVIQCNIRDITDRKHAEEELQKLNAELEHRVEECTAQLAEDIIKRKWAEEERDSTFQQLQTSNQQLTLSARFLNSVIEQNPTSIWIADGKGTLVRMNQACRELFDVTESEVVGKHSILADNLVEAQGHMPLVRDVFEKGTVARFTLDYDARDMKHIDVKVGARMILDVVVSPIRDAQGNVVSAIVQHKDITARRQAEAELGDSEERFSKAFNTSPYAITITRAEDGGFVEVNDAFTSITGCTREEALCHSSVGLKLWANEEDRENVIADLRAGLVVKDRDYQFRTKSGEIITCMFSAQIVKLSSGPCILSSINDITERKHAEEQLVGALHELRVRNAIANVILTVNDDGMYYDVLRIILEALGSEFGTLGYIAENGDLEIPTMTRQIYSECNMPEKSIVFPREGWGDSIWPRAIREQRLLYSNEASTNTPEGHLCIERNISVPLVHQGNVVGLFQVANKPTDYLETDIALAQAIANVIAPVLDARLRRDREEARRRTAEEEVLQLNAELEQRVEQRTAQLQEANSELEAFAHSVSHDLRAPLRGIDGWSMALLEDYADKLDAQGRECLDRVRAETQRMGQLIDDMLKLSRVSRAPMQTGIVDLSAIARVIADRLAYGQPGRHVEFVIQPGLSVEGDVKLLEIALENLLDNAWKFTGKTESAHIEVGAINSIGPEDRVFFVRDNGAGFDIAYVDKLFRPFQRLHRASDFPGTGIGLVTTQRILRRHGGSIWADSQLDHGATFYFSL